MYNAKGTSVEVVARCRYAEVRAIPERHPFISGNGFERLNYIHRWSGGITFPRSVFHRADGSVIISSTGSRGLGNRRRLQVVAALGLLSVVV